VRGVVDPAGGDGAAVVSCRGELGLAVPCWSLKLVVVHEVLASLPVGAGVVRCEDGSVVVTGDVGEGGGSGLFDGDRFHPVKSALDQDRCVVGGLLPPGAVSAEAVDDRGARVPTAVAHGAYVGVLDQPDDGSEPIVCCRDAAGEPVRRPWAGDYPSVRVIDAGALSRVWRDRL
jgi:hypothetical protein